MNGLLTGIVAVGAITGTAGSASRLAYTALSVPVVKTMAAVSVPARCGSACSGSGRQGGMRRRAWMAIGIASGAGMALRVRQRAQRVSDRARRAYQRSAPSRLSRRAKAAYHRRREDLCIALRAGRAEMFDREADLRAELDPRRADLHRRQQP